ncbi:ATP-dependent zinc metalloprotease FtsH [Dissulfurimicrobium hydrothermale]|uniref:ATP-dependent zinc metalloprotease FtsH n=2 Tax=Dissulfurimicrobium hydrothermale TaxID=1750598 RepID=UPI001EDA6DAE|nr:ATP-dependent zinc metalloprotease FtsH [Dissulfurimicrobium hydrothermale]UKL13952.1 ATP-dependent zinc metalloprotease FtsH [Dissulfurimicrobium hydrothermale]
MDKDRKKLIFHAIYWIIGLIIIFGLPHLWLSLQTEVIPYGQFKDLVKQGRILKITIDQSEIKGLLYKGPAVELPDIKEKLKKLTSTDQAGDLDTLMGRRAVSFQELAQQLNSKINPPGQVILFRSTRVEDPKLVETLDQYGVDYSGLQEGFLGQLVWGTLLPILFWVGLWFLLMRSMGRPGAGLLSIGKSKAKVAMEKDTGVRFSDVAGCEEAKEELAEVVEFLKEPQKYEALGAKIPKGVLLLGPPGTGKTLLAKALAGEAGVPFYSISGSEFVEMFVGVGAARVRDLFSQAKTNAPCIIFIDEIDAIGKFRSAGMIAGGHEEREQTLNQLLVEMDGFEPNIGVILLAATNRPEVLDPALLRPGRFDRQVVLDAPDARGREAILEVHSKGKPLAPGVSLKDIAMRTPGFSGADLANVMNEAALLAAREKNSQITQAHLEAAVEKILAGPERKSRHLGDKERRRVAYHEAGHALVAFYCPNAMPVAKISIIPRGRAALGYTLQLPEEEQFLITKNEILDKICVSLGGRAAESEILGEISSGAQNDLEMATEMARGMVCRFGMSEKIGPYALSRETSPYLRQQFAPQQIEAMGPELASEVDGEVRRILAEQDARAKDIIGRHKEILGRVADKLLAQEVMSAEEFRVIIEKNTNETGGKDGS